MKQYTHQTIAAIVFTVFFGSLAAQVKPFSVSPFSLTEKKLNELVKLIGDKRVVAIGEDTHGTSEFYQFREALTKKLISEKGFNVLVLENPHEDIMALEEGLKKENLDTLMKRHLFSIYQTEEVKSFLQWVKTNSRSVRLAGCDDSYRDILPAKLAAEANKYKIAVLDSLVQDFSNRQNLDVEEYHNLPGHQVDKLPTETRHGYNTWLTVLQIDSVIRARKINNRRLSELVFHARTNYEVYRALRNKQFTSRDSLMGARVNWFAANKYNKVIVWAHNAHITRKSLDGEIGLMGETIKLGNPGQYFAIGLTTGSGSYSYIKTNFINNDHTFSDTLFSAELLRMKENSWQHHLQTASTKDFYIDLTKLNKSDSVFFNEKKPFRAIGYKKENPEKVYFESALQPLYDVIVFYQQTRATTQIGSRR